MSEKKINNCFDYEQKKQMRPTYESEDLSNKFRLINSVEDLRKEVKVLLVSKSLCSNDEEAKHTAEVLSKLLVFVNDLGKRPPCSQNCTGREGADCAACQLFKKLFSVCSDFLGSLATARVTTGAVDKVQ